MKGAGPDTVHRSKSVVKFFGVSIFCFGAGTNLDLDHPHGVRGPEHIEWFFATRSFRAMHGQAGGETGVDDGYRQARLRQRRQAPGSSGATSTRSVRGPWPERAMEGLVGRGAAAPTCPSSSSLTTARATFAMKGGTEFAFRHRGHRGRARAGEGGRDRSRRLASAAAPLPPSAPTSPRAYRRQLHLAVRPIVLSAGELASWGSAIRALGYEAAEHTAGERATHVILRRHG